MARQVAGGRQSPGPSLARVAERIDLAVEGVRLVSDLAQMAFAYEHYIGEAAGGVLKSPNSAQLEFEKFNALEVWRRPRK